MPIGEFRPLFLRDYTPDNAAAVSDVLTTKTFTPPRGTTFVRLQNDADVLVTIANGGTAPADPQAGDLLVLANSLEWLQVDFNQQVKLKVKTVSGAGNASPIYGA